MSDVKTINGYNVKDEYARQEIAQMKINFQDGVDTIYNAIVAQGVTPSASTPSACATGIHKMESDVYNAITEKGVTPAANTIPACVTAIPNVYNKGKDYGEKEKKQVTIKLVMSVNSMTGISQASVYVGNTLWLQDIAGGSSTKTKNGYASYYYGLTES